MSSLLTPVTKAAHTAIGPMNIWPALNAVLIQAPWSKLMPSAPRKSANPNDVRRDVNVEIMVPSNTAPIAAYGRRLSRAIAAAVWGSTLSVFAFIAEVRSRLYTCDFKYESVAYAMFQNAQLRS